MLAEREFELAVRIFLRELGAILLLLPAGSADNLEGMRGELEATQEVFSDSRETDVARLAAAAGLLDEFLARRSDLFQVAYQSYQTDVLKGSAS
jgi:hypothetical protein